MPSRLLAFTLAAGLAAPHAAASTFTAFVSFGDSFADRANTAAILADFAEAAFGVPDFVYPPPPYKDLQYSNGPVFAEIVGAEFEATGKAYANFAHGSARGARLDTSAPPPFGIGFDIPDFEDQRMLFESSGLSFGARPLASVFFGGNDIDDPVGLTLSALSGVADPEAIRQAVRFAVIQGALAGAQSIAEQVAEFDQAVVNDFLLYKLPDLAISPRYSDPSLPLSAFGDIVAEGTALFNQTLAGLVPGLEAAGYNITLIDVAELIADLQANGDFETDENGRLIACGRTVGLALGLFPLTSFDGCDAFGPGANERFWWDEIHPTAGVHAALADLVLDTIRPAVIPLPAPAALLAGGLLLLAGLRRRRA